MTTVGSTLNSALTGANRSLEVHNPSDSLINFTILRQDTGAFLPTPEKLGITVNKADFLALPEVAAVTKERALAMVEKEREHCHEMKARAETAEAKLEKVEKAVAKLRKEVRQQFFNEANKTYVEGVITFLEEALSDEPEFVLPTEEGEEFVAYMGSTEMRFKTVRYQGDGSYQIYYLTDASLWNAEQVLGYLSGHKNIEKAA
jgi:hypothetical protein